MKSMGKAVREGRLQVSSKTHEYKLARSQKKKKERKFKEARVIAGLDAASYQWSESADQQQHV